MLVGCFVNSCLVGLLGLMVCMLAGWLAGWYGWLVSSLFNVFSWLFLLPGWFWNFIS